MAHTGGSLLARFSRRLVIIAIFAVGGPASQALGQVVGSVLYPLLAPQFFIDVSPNSIAPSATGPVGGLGTSIGNESFYALLWNGPSGSVTNLNPTGSLMSDIAGTTASQQIGSAQFFVTIVNSDDNDLRGDFDHAGLWSGTAASFVDLNPANFPQSFGYGMGGNQQVGYAVPNGGGGLNGGDQAFLWTGTAASAVNLNPTNISGFTNTQAIATDGVHQVGNGWGPATGGAFNSHALLWGSTANSAVDLEPTDLPGFITSFALGVDGDQQVGYGNGNMGMRALLWQGTAESAVDLTPDALGFSQAEAVATNGIQQVGYAGTGSGPYVALLWSGTAGSAVNLQSLLPASGQWTSSQALSIDPNGDVFGIAQGTYGGYTGSFAVEWSPVPEPAGISLLAICGPLLMRRREN